MIEKIIIDYLSAHSVAAYAEDPPGKPATPYCIIEKTGGGETEHLRHATVAVKSFGDTLFGAAAANKAVVALMLGMDALDAIASISLNSDYNYTDTATKRYRYQAVFDIYYYEEANSNA